MPLAFEDQLGRLSAMADRLLIQVEHLQKNQTVIYQRREGALVDVTEEWLAELEGYLELIPELFQKLLAQHRNQAGDLGA